MRACRLCFVVVVAAAAVFFSESISEFLNNMRHKNMRKADDHVVEGEVLIPDNAASAAAAQVNDVSGW